MQTRTKGWGERLAGAAGFAVALAVVVFAVSGWRIAGGDGRPGADIIFSATPTGELAVTPAGPFLRSRGLRPGQRAQASLEVRNQTGAWLDVTLRALPDRPDLDAVLLVDVRSAGKSIFSGPLGLLRSWSRPLVVGPGEQATLTFTASFASDLKTGYGGRTASVPLEFQARPVQ